MRAIRIFAVVLFSTGFLSVHAQDNEPTFEHVALHILPKSADADSAEATKVFKETMRAMKAAPGCVGGYISKTSIMSPAGSTDYQLIMATFWDSDVSFLDFIAEGGGEKYGPGLVALGAEMLAYSVDQ